MRNTSRGQRGRRRKLLEPQSAAGSLTTTHKFARQNGLHHSKAPHPAAFVVQVELSCRNTHPHSKFQPLPEVCTFCPQRLFARKDIGPRHVLDGVRVELLIVCPILSSKRAKKRSRRSHQTKRRQFCRFRIFLYYHTIFSSNLIRATRWCHQLPPCLGLSS